MNTGDPLQTSTRHDQHGQWPQAGSVEEFRHNLAAVHARIAAACQRVGRDPAGVRLLPVSKTKPEATLRLAYAAGCRMLGENKPQEAYQKWEAMADLADLRWSVIGHLQTNKAKLVARFASEFQALDSLRVAEALEKRLQIEGRGMDVFVQVNTSGEASKYGLHPDDAAAFLRELPAFPALRVRGLMTLALFSAEADRDGAAVDLEALQGVEGEVGEVDRVATGRGERDAVEVEAHLVGAQRLEVPQRCHELGLDGSQAHGR